METLNDRIKQLRKEKGLTQNQLADLLGVTDKAVSKWEVGEANPDITLLVKIGEVFGVTVDYLLTGKIEETISLDDMDDEKRFNWILKRDDKNNFVKYGYLNSSRIFGRTHDLQSFFRRGINHKATIEGLNDSVWKEIIKCKAYKILDLCLDETLKKNGKDGYWFTFTVCDFLDDFVKAVVDLDRDDVLKAIGAQYFCIGQCSGNSRNNKPMLIGASNFIENKQAYTIKEETFDYIYNKEKDSPRCFSLMMTLRLTGVTADMIQFGKANNEVYVVSYLPEYLIQYFAKKHRYDYLKKCIDVVSGEFKKAETIIKANAKDSTYVRYACLSDSYVWFENSYSGEHEIVGRIIQFPKELILMLISENQLDLARAMNDHNKAIFKLIGNNNQHKIRKDKNDAYVLTEQEIDRMVKLNSKDISNDEKMILECVDEYVINKDKFESLSDVKLAKKILDSYYYNYYEFTYDCLVKRNIKPLFKFFVDNDLTGLAEKLMKGEEYYPIVLDEIWRSFEEFERKDKLGLKQNRIFSKDKCFRNDHVDWNELSEYGFSEDQTYNEEGEEINWQGDLTENNVLIKIIKSRKADMLAVVEQKAEKIRQDVENAKERAKIVKGLDKKYFDNLLSRNEVELFIIKLCALFDAILKFDFKCDGDDFNIRMNQYFDNGPKSQYVDDGWGYDTLDEKHEETVVRPWNDLRDLFNRLRIQRNNIAHSESKPVKELSAAELTKCMEHVFSINKEGK